MPSVKTFSRKKVKTHGKHHGKHSMKKNGKPVKTSKSRRLRKTKGGDGENDKVVIIENTRDPKKTEVISISKTENIKEYKEIKTNMAEIVGNIEKNHDNNQIISKIEDMIAKIETKNPQEINNACNEVHGDACKENTKSSSIFSSIFGTNKSRTAEESLAVIHDCNAEMDCKLDNIKIYYVYGEAIIKYLDKANIDENVLEKLTLLLRKIEDYKNVYLDAIGVSSGITSVTSILGIANRYFNVYDAKEFLQRKTDV